MVVESLVEITKIYREADMVNLENHHQEEWSFNSGGPVFSPDGSVLAWIANEHEVVIVGIIHRKEEEEVSSSMDRRHHQHKRKIVSKCPITCLRFGYRHHRSLFHFPWWRQALNDSSSSSSEDEITGGGGGGVTKDSPLLLTGHRNGNIKLYDVKSCSLLTTLLSHSSTITDLAFMPPSNNNDSSSSDNIRFISISVDKTLKVWDGEPDGYNMSQTIKHSNSLFSCAWSPNGKLVATGGLDRIVYIHRISPKKGGGDMTLEHKFRGHHDVIVGCAFTPDSALLATGSWDTRVNLWDVETGEIKQTLCHTFPIPLLVFSNPVRCLSMGPHGSFLTTISGEGSLYVWDMEHYGNPSENAVNAKSQITLNNANLNACALSSQGGGHLLAVCDDDKSITIYNVIRSPPALLHLVRLNIRSTLSSQSQIKSLTLPQTLEQYLNYDIWI